MSRDSNAASEPLPPGQLVALTIALSLAVFMNALDVSIANVSAPNIAGDLGVSSQHGTWIITSFAAARAILLPITGWMARRVGELRLFVWSTLAFTAFSLLCGLAWSFPVLVAARALQGMAAGPVMPLSQSLLLANFPRHRHGFANGIWAMMIVVGPVLAGRSWAAGSPTTTTGLGSSTSTYRSAWPRRS
ncbi:MAG: MFS transporter [Salinisphaera sp.]|uniref:MFS transporter n=1 Tax=Salinisphaera sp. TaxID=1914330 RepID=UPI003C7A25ED